MRLPETLIGTLAFLIALVVFSYKEMYEVGNRRGHYRAFISLLRNAMSWEAATKTYGNINVPAFLIWGDKDWSRPREREHDRSLIPCAQMVTVENGGHSLTARQSGCSHQTAQDGRPENSDLSPGGTP